MKANEHLLTYAVRIQACMCNAAEGLDIIADDAGNAGYGAISLNAGTLPLMKQRMTETN
ncbi:hypothetical protein BH23CHL5_BH23CHL5_28210 [soil metagenome]